MPASASAPSRTRWNSDPVPLIQESDPPGVQSQWWVTSQRKTVQQVENPFPESMGIPDDAVIATYPDGLDGSEPFAVCWRHLLPVGTIVHYSTIGTRLVRAVEQVASVPVLVDIPKPLVVTFPDGQTLPLDVLDQALREISPPTPTDWTGPNRSAGMRLPHGQADAMGGTWQPIHAARRDVFAAIDAQAVKP